MWKPKILLTYTQYIVVNDPLDILAKPNDDKEDNVTFWNTPKVNINIFIISVMFSTLLNYWFPQLI